MSLWELSAAVEGYNRANAPTGTPGAPNAVRPPSSDEHRAALARCA